MTNSVGMTFVLIPFFSKEVTNTRRPLPLKIWLPFDVTDSNYWYIFCIQVVHTMFTCTQSMGLDMLFFGFMMRIVHQMDLMTHRLRELGLRVKNGIVEDTDKILADIVRHQYLMFRYVH